MTDDELDAKVRDVVARVADLEPAAITAEGDLYRDLGVRSTTALDLLLSLEEELEVSIPDESFGDARTVASLVSLIGALR